MAATPAQLNVTLEAGAEGAGHVEKFEKAKGSRFIRQLLADCGITSGNYTYHLKEWYKSSGFTRPVQARRYDASGVYLWLKPGGNGSAMKGYLSVDRNLTSPEAVYNAIRAYCRAEDEHRAHAAEADPDKIDDTTAELVLLAVNAAHTKHHRDVHAFEAAVIEELRANSFETDGDTLGGMFRSLVRRGFLEMSGVPVISLKGQRWLDDPNRGIPEEPPAPPSPPPPPPASALDLLKHKRKQLERLLEIPRFVEESQGKQRALEQQITALMSQLESEQQVEKSLMSEVDEDAVRLLLEGK